MLKSQLRRAAQTPQNQKLPSSYPSGALIRIGALGGWESSISFLAFPYWMIWPCHHVCAQSPNWQLYFWGWALPDVKRGLQLLVLFDLQCPSGTSNVSRHSDSFESRSVLVDDYWNSMGFASAEISASHSHCRSRFELHQVGYGLSCASCFNASWGWNQWPLPFRHPKAGLRVSRMSKLPKASADEDDEKSQQCPRCLKHSDPE